MYGYSKFRFLVLILVPLLINSLAYGVSENFPPQEAVEFQKSVQELEAQRLKAHEELKAKGGSIEQHKMIDDEALTKARSLETKRTSSLKKLGKEAGVGEIGQGEYGTEPTKGRGAFGDVDTPNYSGKDFEKIRAAAKKAGYDVTIDGDTMHIKELDTTVHREPSKYKSQTGSSASDAEAAGGYGKETSRKLQTGDKTTEVLDNLGKSGNTLNKPTKQMKSSDWQEMGKMTGRNMEAANIVDEDFAKKLKMLKEGYRPESVGIDDMDAFQQKCRELNNQAAKKVRTDAKIKEVKLKEKLTQAKSDLEKAQSTGNQKKIRETTNKLKRTQSEIAEHSKRQKAAEDSFKKNQPKEAKKILEETKPPPKEKIDDMIRNERTAKKTKVPSDADDLVQKPKSPSDADEMMGKKSKAPSDADEMMGKPGKQSKVAAPTTGKKTYVKIAKDAATGAITAIVIFSTAEDIKQKLKKGDVKGAGKIIADNLTGGAISITEQNVEKYSDYKEMKNKVANANKMEYEAYVLKAGLQLRENDVSKEETEKIMDDMRRGDRNSFENKRNELQKAGKNISVTPPKHIDNIGGDEDIITRTADVFVAIGDGILAMPGKAKKFISEASSDVYEIVGGLTEKGVLTELCNQKVESANNLLDIVKNEYRTYTVNKEIEEQKEQKDKFEQQKLIREKLMAQGVSFEEANAIAKKAAHEGDWSAFKKARLDIQAQKEAEAMAAKAGIHSEDVIDFLNCMCRACGGSLGGFYNPKFKSDIGHGPCQCNGPLTIWKTPVPSEKKGEITCFNEITAMNYAKDQAVFNEWHQRILDENAQSVQEEVKQIEAYMTTGEYMEAADLFKAIEALIKDYMVTKYYDGKAQGENLSYSLAHKIVEGLRVQAKAHAEDVSKAAELKESVKKQSKACELGTNAQWCEKEVEKYKAWEKGWHDATTKDIPDILNMLDKGQVNTASTFYQALQNKINQQLLPPRSNDPIFTTINEKFREKRNEYDAVMTELRQEIIKLNKVPTPRTVVKMIESVQTQWEHSYINQKYLGWEHNVASQNVRIAASNDKSGDEYKEQKKYALAVDRYQVSLKFQIDKTVQCKLSELLNMMDAGKNIHANGQKQWKEGKIVQAINTIQNGIDINPSDTTLAKVLIAMKKQKEQLDAKLQQTIDLIQQYKLNEADNMLSRASAINDKYPKYQEVLQKLIDAKRKSEEEKKEELAAKVREIRKKQKEEAKKDALRKKIQSIKAAKSNEVVKNTEDGKREPSKQEKNYVLGFAGKWNSTYGVMELRVEGLRVSGNYTHDKGRIEALLSTDGKTMKGTWAESPSYQGSRDAGKMYFKLSPNGQKIDGLWSYGEAVPDRGWIATRINSENPTSSASDTAIHDSVSKLDTTGIDGIEDIDKSKTSTSKAKKIITSTSFESDVSAGKIKNIVKTKATLSFWNVGTKLSGYGEATMDVKSVSSLNGSTQEMHYSGTFSGGPNGIIKLSDGEVSITLKVMNGKRVKVDGQEVYFIISDPIVFK